MYTAIHDKGKALLVAILSGVSNTRADYDAAIEDLKASSRAGAGRNDGVVRLMLAEDGNPPPTAAERKRIVDFIRSERTLLKQYFAMVTGSALTRAAVTAIAWFAPPGHEASAHATIEQALAWIEERRPGVSSRLKELVPRVREKSAQQARVAKASGA